MDVMDRARTLVAQTFSTTSRTLNGKKLKIPFSAGHGGKNTRVHEDFLDAFLFESLKTVQGVFVDVGANLGQILLKVVTQRPDIQYVGFEPSSFCASYVERIIELNSFGNAQVFPFALSDAFKFLTFYHSDSADEQATTVADFWTEKNSRSQMKKIACLCGDDVMASLATGPVGILKIDVEGGELEVLKGFEQTIRNDKPLILVEILPYLSPEKVGNPADARIMEKRRDRIQQVLAFVDLIGYDCKLINPTGGLSPADRFEVEVYDASLANYALVPKV